MRFRSAASVLLALVYYTAGAEVTRWSKAERDLAQGEWVPLNNERLNKDSARIPSAINPQHFNQALQHHSQPNPFPREYQSKQILGAQSAPPRIAFLHPQSINPQALPQTQVQPQVLPQFLSHQIGQPDLPEINGALLRKQPLLNSNYYHQQENFNFDPNYSNLQGFKNAQYTFGTNADYENAYTEAEKQSEIPIQSQLKSLQPNIDNVEYRNNSKKKEEVQILYVPVEMLRQQEQARKAGKNIPLPDTGFPNDARGEKQQYNNQDSQKFRHPIQPLREQTPAHHLRGASSYPTDVISRENPDTQSKFRKPSYSSQRTTIPPRNEYYPKYNSNAPGNKEQYVDESIVQDEISDYRNTVTRRAPPKEPITPTTLPPPNQPPLSVFMESTNNNRISDVLSLLKDSKTIPVLDSVGSDAPQVFVGPSNLNTPFGYIKYELPYLSSFHSSAPQKLSQVPFFVAPLNFQPPPGFAKIPFPPPHIGSVVLSNVTSKQFIDEVNIPTPENLERHTPSYKETFTIPADISSISPQLPSLINSLQEDEYLGASSTESLSEPTEEPTVKYRRPTSRRQNNRGSQRGYDSSTTTTTRRPVSRQRRPSSRYTNQRINQNPESKPNLSEEQYSDNTQYNYNSNKQPNTLTTPDPPAYQTSKNYEFSSPDPPRNTQNFPISNENEKQEQTHLVSSQDHFNNPAVLHGYSNEEIGHQNDDRSGSVYHQGRTHHFEQPSAHYQDTGTSDALTHETHTQNNQFLSNVPNKSFDNYEPQQQYSPRPAINFEQQSYSSGLHSQARVQDSSGSLNTNDELQYKNIYKENTEAPQEGAKENLNYRLQDHQAGHQQSIQNPSLLKTFTEQSKFQVDDRSNYHPPSDVTTDKQQINGYFGSFDNNNSPGPNVHLDTPDNYGGTLVTNRPSYQTNAFAQTTSRTNDENDHVDDKINYEHKDDQQKRVTERPVPTRTRSRFRGRTQSQHTTPSHSFQDEDGQKVGRLNQNEEVSQYRTESAQYTTTEQVPVTQSRKYLHSRGRRPLRPTLSTTASPATTTAPPGTKYLIRTRRPTTAPTKLPGGRSRIRKPTTPTTTTPQPTTTTEYPRTLSFQYQQPPADEEYTSNEQVRPAHEPIEYRGSPQYQDGRTNIIRLQNPSNVQDTSYHQRRNHHKTASEPSHDYNYESGVENVPTKKQYKPTDVPQYSGFERTQTPLLPQEYDITTKPTHSREYERVSKPYIPREYEATPKSYSLKDYEETQKPHYVREYEATLKPRYTKDYETTTKPLYTREYVITQKPQFSREYDSTVKTKAYNQYDSSQAIQNHRNLEPAQISEQYSDYETTTKPQFEREYASTHKPQNIRQNDATVTQSYQDYETTQKPYFNQRTQSSTPTRTHNNLRRRPSVASRGEKTSKYNKPESSTASATTKDSTADFWNQAVTIQQSQSYVYNPDENQERTEETSKTKSNSQPNIDYDDFYGFQEGGQYSSDQSPFPSNDQHVTYTKAKPYQEIGKANQYPEKPTFNTNISDENNEEKIVEEKSYLEPDHQESTSVGIDDQNTWNDSKSNSDFRGNHASASVEDLPATQNNDQPSSSPETQPSSTLTHKKNGKRRGTWVRVRVKKPKDVFETAESQRFSAVRENALISDGAKTIAFGLGSSENVSASKIGFNEGSNEQQEVTTYNVKTVRPSPSSVDEKSVITSTELSNNTENLDSTTVSTIPNIQEEYTTITTSPVAQENITQNPETFRTSTTTEISLETEICYKGQCIKTKRRKNESDRDSSVLI